MATRSHMITLAGPLGVTWGRVSRTVATASSSGLQACSYGRGGRRAAASLAQALEFHGHLKAVAAPCGHHGKCPHWLVMSSITLPLPELRVQSKARRGI